MKKHTISLRILLSFAFCLVSAFVSAQQTNSQYVDPMIGTGGHGHTFPGATVPFGMVQLSPDTRIDDSWDGCSGYHYSDTVIYGFSHTHLSGTGCSDYGDINLMPTVGNISVDSSKYASGFSHKNEKASAGYYSVKLKNKVNVELTATTRVGFHKYTFPKTTQANIILDLTHRDKTLESTLAIVSATEVEGMRRSEAWAQDQHIYFVIQFSKPFVETIFINNVKQDRFVYACNFEPLHIDSSTNIKAAFTFKTAANEAVYMKVGISTVSIEGARNNLKAELPGWDFEKTKLEARLAWDKELSKIQITTDNKDQLKTFYTALYHTMIQPNVNMDVDGMYRGRDNQIHHADGFTYYSVFSLWDTFRAAHPLYTIIDRTRTLDFVKTFLAQFKDGGRLPVWELASNETDCMIGYHSVSVIADAAVKGIHDFDLNLALEAMKKSATWDHLGLPAYMDHGCITMDDEHESVSKTVEYSYDDWCIAQVAKMLDKQADYDTYMKRSQYWKNVFDPGTGFMRPKKNGNWLTPFEPREVNNNFTEGNSWQYTFFVPQDLDGLIRRMGGPENFEKKLDELFTTTTKTTGREQADITGLIGQYAQGNEPSHHMAYLYDFVGKSWKTEERIHQICTQFYKAAPDGLIGNEDCGQMSAWFVLSSLGIYEVTPGSGNYVFGTPLFKEAKINLENGNSLAIKTINFSATNFYVDRIKYNDALLNPRVIKYDNIMNGGTLEFSMSAVPTKQSEYDITPLYDVNEKQIVVNPIIAADSRVFKNALTVNLKADHTNDNIYYTRDGSDPTINSILYTAAFTIDTTTTVKAIEVSIEGDKSFITSGTFYKMPHPDWKIKINAKYNAQYTAGGDEGLIDGMHGTENWRKGDWQGYQSQDFEAVIDLGKEQKINAVSSTYLQDSRAWILFPTKVEYSFSNDGITYSSPVTVINSADPKDNKVQVKQFQQGISQNVTARYVKVKAINFGKLPEWHQGAGGDAFIFVDEVEVY
ncbi:MAG: putative hybrid glycoside hydrolase, group 92(-20) family protein precursor [Bacteroidetes bacterium]|nr:putative hybrid glycoside hydrolase, group 92(-20) family protein precursor [Bacteroidota bacterium]